MSSDFPLSVRSRNFLFSPSRQGGRGCVFAALFAPIPKKGISDYIAQGSIIRVFTVYVTTPGAGIKPVNTGVEIDNKLDN